jgi:hypothetical protein
MHVIGDQVITSFRGENPNENNGPGSADSGQVNNGEGSCHSDW